MPLKFSITTYIRYIYGRNKDNNHLLQDIDLCVNVCPRDTCGLDMGNISVKDSYIMSVNQDFPAKSKGVCNITDGYYGLIYCKEKVELVKEEKLAYFSIWSKKCSF